jgi:GGDEF domain-containing protein
MLDRGTLAILRWLPAVLVLLPWLLMPRMPSDDGRLRDLTGSAAFRLLDWETINLGQRAGRLWSALLSQQTDLDDAETLRAYFGDRNRWGERRASAEAAIERVISQTFQDAGVSRSTPVGFDKLFPPVLVALTPPPNVLVVSPRSELRVTGSVVLKGLDDAEQAHLEASADSTGVSSLVAPVGGLATFPAMVLEDDSPERVLTSVAHEWLHHYLIFYPLGARYWDSQEAREINETTAELVGTEVGRQVAARLDLHAQPRSAAAARSDGFDFRAFMRQTRLQVEQLLAQGSIEEAERFMEARRLELEQHGYPIRKLNQAYFALYGSYGDSFAASPRSPIPGLLRQLREQSGSLADFLFRVRTITSVAELRAAVG